MAATRARYRPVVVAPLVTLGLLWVLALAFHWIPAIEPTLARAEYFTLDLRARIDGPRAAPKDVVIIAIDDETVRIGGGYPLPRDALARITRNVTSLAPRAIVYDIAFLQAGQPQADRAFAQALSAAPAAVAAFANFRSGASPAGDGFPAPSKVDWPTEPIRGASRQGIANIVTDETGIPRHIPLLFSVEGGVTPSLALLGASIATQTTPRVSSSFVQLGGDPVPLDSGGYLALRYYGPSGTFQRVSASGLLSKGPDSAQLSGKVAVIGVTATGAGDMFATPFDRQTPGVEVLATGIAALLGGEVLRHDYTARTLETVGTLALPLLILAALFLCRARAGAAHAVAVMAGWIFGGVAAFHFDEWIGVARPLAAALPVFALALGGKLAAERTLSQRLSIHNAALGRLQPPRLVEALERDPNFLSEPIRRDVAIVFLDLSGFTRSAEALGPEGARALLMTFQTIVEREAADLEGVVVSFMGDGAMVVFGLPYAHPDDAAHALLAMRRLSATCEAWLAGQSGPSLHLRLAGHFGPAVLSRLGPAHHQNVAATGDTVNVASRLIEFAKERDARIVVSDAIYAAAKAPDGTTFQTIALRGREATLRVAVLR